MKWIAKNLPWLTLCAVGIALTPAAFQAALAFRGYRAFGGEVFVPLIIPVVWYLFRVFIAFTKEVFNHDYD